MKRTKIIAILALAAWVLIPWMTLTVSLTGPALAAQHESVAGAEKAAGKEEHAESPLAVVFRWANFAILLGGLVYLMRKPAREFFESRKRDILSGLERAEKAQEESDRRLAEIAERQRALAEDIAALRLQSDEESVRERERVVAETRREVERVVEQSRQEIERIAHSVEREIKEKIAEVVVERAGQQLQTKMTDADQKRVVVRFIKNL